MSDIVDTLKIMATVEPTSFRWLELPPIGEMSRSVGRLPKNTLEELCESLTEERRAHVVSPGNLITGYEQEGFVATLQCARAWD